MQDQRQHYGFNASPETHALARTLAAREQISIRELVRRALEAYAANSGATAEPRLEVRA